MRNSFWTKNIFYKGTVQHVWIARDSLELTEFHLNQYMDSSNIWAALRNTYKSGSKLLLRLHRTSLNQLCQRNKTTLSWQRRKKPYVSEEKHLSFKVTLTCPTSSKAITTTAAPYNLIFLAFSRKSSSPSFRLMLFTMHFPWQHFKPASITEKFEESMHNGTCK